jgi:tellurite methyltransferase
MVDVVSSCQRVGSRSTDSIRASTVLFRACTRLDAHRFALSRIHTRTLFARSIRTEDSVTIPQQSRAQQDTPNAKRSSLSPDYQRNWPDYFDAIRGQPPRDTCLRALASFAAQPHTPPRLALDIACGEGRDTRAILASNPAWRVIATDASVDGLTRLLASLASTDAPRVTIAHVAMEDLPAWCARNVRQSIDLINASFALPFCHPDHFPSLWNFIEQSLSPHGRFAGQFFGDRDEWACVRPKSHFTREHVAALFARFNVEHLEEVEKEGSDAMGGIKHHHVYHVVAQRS